MSHLSRIGKTCHGSHILPRVASSIRNSRLYSMAAVPLSETPKREWKPIERKQPQPAQITRLENGMTVASIEDYSSTTRIALYVNAGSRYERFNTLGASHVMKICAFLANKENSALKITREAELLGANLQAKNTREHLIISSDFLRDRVQPVLSIIASTVKDPCFYRWEVNDRKDHLFTDLAAKDTDIHAGHYQCDFTTFTPNFGTIARCVRLVMVLILQLFISGIMEAVHQVAYRGPLANSIYCPSFRANSLFSDVLQSFAQECFTGPAMTLVGLGVNHDEFVQIASSSFEGISAKRPGEKQKSFYVGGDARWWADSPLVNAAVVTEGVGLVAVLLTTAVKPTVSNYYCSLLYYSLEDKDILAAGLLTRILGGSPLIKYGNNTETSRLSKSVSEATTSPYTVSSLNINYSDSGLLGSYVIANAADIDKVLKAIVNQYRSVAEKGISNDELTRAKNQLKAYAAMSYENPASIMQDLAVQAGYTGSYKSPVDVLNEVDKASVEDVVKVAKRLFSAPLTLVASGNIEKVPAL
ncbi:Cytochrome b-c1 complex subunit 2, mitochondrial [Trichoplax sp. H2]|nr:Cytochrome b-c1 complex subunit 2, mitochondrial [Trichoplax sp. H2]|eukprot:RDD42054.1 Cytochrome b-c1 complex subunit 2, mitochondrial [Trichoplax sp. H2]